MTTLDWIIVAFTLVMAVWGYMQGLVVGALSLVGFVAGAFLGSRLAPVLLSGGSASPYAPLVSLVVAVVLGGVLATVLDSMQQCERGRHVIGQAGVRPHMRLAVGRPVDTVGAV